MSASRFWAFEYFESVLSVEVDPGVNLDESIDFLSRHFVCAPVATPVDGFVHLRLRPIESEDARFANLLGWQDMFVRESASDFFTIPARRLRVDGLELIECTKTSTRFVFDRVTSAVEVQLGSSGQRDFVELVRDLVLKDQENRGAVPLHATTAYRPGSCVVVAGSKGAGKSTILLELVENFGYQIVSGDRTLLRATSDGDFEIAGWPDYPHLGYATIAKYDGLRAIAGLSDAHVPASDYEFSPYNKYAVGLAGFRARFANAPQGLTCRPTLVIQPDIGPGEQTVLTPVADALDKRVADLEHNLESGFSGPHAGWQTFSENLTALHRETQQRLLRLLAGVPAFELSGPGDLTVDIFGPVLAGVVRS